ncbi:MAG: sodium:proton antiporter, partial [Lachnospiraceae bacterium]
MEEELMFWQNIPFFCIILSMISGTLSSVLSAKAAKWLNTCVILTVGILSAVLFLCLLQTGESYTYMMGHYPAPWGNEIRAGILEAGMALFFSM